MPLVSRRGIAANCIRRLRTWRPIWLRPAFESEDDMLRAIDGLAPQAPQIHVMCHSNEFWPGGSPYSRTPEDVARNERRLSVVLDRAVSLGAVPVTLSEYAEILSHDAVPVP
jgi:hypothetical protein